MKSSNDRELRTEARIEEIVKFLETPKYLDQIVSKFEREWLVGMTTIRQSINTAIRQRKIFFDRRIGQYRRVDET